jgi:dihydroxyacetone kinase-like protein
MSFKLNAQDIKKMIEKLALVFENQKDYLNELDSKIGDGDHGLSMSRVFSAITKYIQKMI